MENSDILSNFIPNYEWQDDYYHLWSLVKKERVICLVNYDNLCKDIASTHFNYVDRLKNPICVTVSARGICYILASNREDFIDQCKKNNLKYILPTGR